MADLFSVTAPLVIRYPDGEKQLIIRCFPHGDGLIFAAPYWDRLPANVALRFVAGPLKGDGPWKAGDAVITVLGCHGTEPELAGQFADWQDYLQQCGDAGPDEARLHELALHFRQQSPSE